MGLPLVFLLLVVGVSCAVVLLLLLRRRGRTGVTHPVCGRCGYAVRGLPTFTCPECGADLREVGIVTPAQRGPIGPVGRVILWTLILPLPALVLTGLAAQFALPMRVTRGQTCHLGGPASGAYTGIFAMASGQALRWPGRAPAPPGLTEVHFVCDDSSPRGGALRVDVQTLGYSYVRDGGSTPVRADRGFDINVVRDWFRANGIDVTTSGIDAEATTLVALVHAARGGNMSSIAPSGFKTVNTGSSSGTSTAYGLPYLLGFWGIVWLIGLWLCIRRRQPGSTAGDAARPEAVAGAQ